MTNSGQIDITTIPLDELETDRGEPINYVSEPDKDGEIRVVYNNTHVDWASRCGIFAYGPGCIRRKKKRIQGWMNIFPGGGYRGATLWPTKEEADMHNSLGSSRVACIYIDVEEGEGL
jgi:hypothetical protein